MAEKRLVVATSMARSASVESTVEERHAAAIAHATVVVPVLGVLAALWLWHEERRRSPYVGAHASQAVALQLSVAFLWLLEGFLYAAIRVSTTFIFTWMSTASSRMEISPWWFTVISALPGLTVAAMLLLQLGAIVYGLYGSRVAHRGGTFQYLLIGRWLRERSASLRVPDETRHGGASREPESPEQ